MLNFLQTWQDLKSRTKIKASKNKEACQKYNDEIPAIEQEILQLISSSENTLDPLEIAAESNEEYSTGLVETSIEDVKPIIECESEIQLNISSKTAPSLFTSPSTIDTIFNKNTSYKTTIKQTLETDINIPTTSNMAVQLELENRNKLLKDYYTKKLVLTERIALAQERRALATERLATAQELIASNKCQCNCTKNNKIINLGF